MFIIRFILVVFFITACHTTSLKQTEKAGASKRGISAIDPNPSSGGFSQENYSIVSGPVSKMVLFKGNRPLCAVSAVENPSAVPSYFKIAESDDIQLRLPTCNQVSLSQMKNMAQNNMYLDKKGEVQTAFLHVVPAAFCLGGAALGYFMSHDFTEKENRARDFMLSVLSPLALGSMLIHVKGDWIVKARPVLGRTLSSVGVAGLCFGGSYSAVGLYRFFR